MRKRALAIGVGLVMLFAVTEARAWDGQRKGFIFGGGMGLGVINITDTLSEDFGAITVSHTFASETQFAFIDDMRIGYAPTNKLMVYAFGTDSWFTFKEKVFNVITGQESYTGGSWSTVSSLTGIGVSYYLKPEAPSWMFSGGLGIAQLKAYGNTAPSGNYSGGGFMLGAGYEFRKYWSVEFNLIYGEPASTDNGVKSQMQDLSFVFLVNVIGY